MKNKIRNTTTGQSQSMTLALQIRTCKDPGYSSFGRFMLNMTKNTAPEVLGLPNQDGFGHLSLKAGSTSIILEMAPRARNV